MSKTIELVRQEVETIKNEVEDFANSASRIGEAMGDILEYNKELTETEANRAKDVEQSLSEEINNIKEAISNIGGEGGEGSKEVTRAEFELVKTQSKGTFDAFSELGMTEKADADGYEIALAKATNTAEKTKVKVPVFDVQNMAKNPAGLVNEMFVEDMALMMDDKINDALEDFTPPEGGGSIEVVDSLTSTSTTDALSAKQGKVLNEKIEQAVNIIPIPDDEDVTKTEEGKLKFANRGYDSLAPNGMGYVIVRKNKSLTEQITSGTNNTIYEIRYNFDLDGKTVYVGSGCAFKFVGGKISNGTIDIKNDSISDYDILRIEAGAYQIFDSVTINGEFTADKIYVDWFGAKGDYNTDDTEAFRYALKTLNNSGKSVHLSNNKTYRVTGCINYWDGIYNNISRVAIIGNTVNQGDEYPAKENRPSVINLMGEGMSLFMNADIAIRLEKLSVFGDWSNHYSKNIKFFNGCVLKKTIICDCAIKYIYCMFYSTGIWGVSSIHDNQFIGVYNFSYIEDGATSMQNSFVDSRIRNNYINGGAAQAEKFTDQTTEGYIVDNRFFDWRQFNGSRIEFNFIDYYCTMYNNSSRNVVITSNSNEYQVFRYFHKQCSILSINDKFNWNNPDAERISEIMGRYKKEEYVQDGTTHYIPPYIASDRFVGYSVIFKDMVLEYNIANVIFRTGFTDDGANGTKFIVELHDGDIKYKDGALLLNKENAIVYKEGLDAPVYNVIKDVSCVSIDKRLAKTVTELPTDSAYSMGTNWGKIGIGEHLLYNGVYYTVGVYSDGTRFYSTLYKNSQENEVVKPSTITPIYPSNYKIKIQSKCNRIYPVAANEAQKVIRVIDIPNPMLVGELITLYFAGTTTFENYHDGNGNILVANKGDIVTVVKLPDGTVTIAGIFKKSGNVTAGTLASAPSGASNGASYYATDLQLTVYWNDTRGAWVNADGYAAGPRSGARRAELTDSLTGIDAGLQFYDTLLGKPVIWNGTDWVDATGTTV